MNTLEFLKSKGIPEDTEVEGLKLTELLDEYGYIFYKDELNSDSDNNDINVAPAITQDGTPATTQGGDDLVGPRPGDRD